VINTNTILTEGWSHSYKVE